MKGSCDRVTVDSDMDGASGENGPSKIDASRKSRGEDESEVG